MNRHILNVMCFHCTLLYKGTSTNSCILLLHILYLNNCQQKVTCFIFQILHVFWYDLKSTTKDMGLCTGFLEVQKVAGVTEEQLIGGRSKKVQPNGFSKPNRPET